ncbi:cytochrome c oxidase assembly protein COX18, mitochondrial-like isoform X1 [Cloeon dipterum]|uniref:cytochrome c oxidase assembly protein COX18, mitochondrial-like isoform X1 n=1 Tax=Cloeon dipterum TaxID=197152 RepID=UPI00321F6239
MQQVLRCCPVLTRSLTVRVPGAVGPAVQQRRNVESAPQGFFQSLADSYPVQQTQSLLESIHEVSGLPWWASIGLTTVLLRTTITLPLTVYQHKIFARLENIRQEMKDLLPEMKAETAIAIKKFNWDEKQAKSAFSRSMKKQFNQRVVRDNCHPLKSTVVIWAQLPMWVCLSVSLRNMAGATEASAVPAQITFLELTQGGCLWIPNLTVPDASWILPVALGLINLAIVEMQVATRTAKSGQPPGKLQRYMTNFFRLLSVGMVPLAATVPSCMSLYWTVSSTCGLAHNLVIMSPRFRRLVKVPKSPQELDNPYQNLVNHFRQRLKL